MIRNIAENFNCLSRVHERYRQTTDGRRRQIIANVNVSLRSLIIDVGHFRTQLAPACWTTSRFTVDIAFSLLSSSPLSAEMSEGNKSREDMSAALNGFKQM